jgi:UDP-glucose 4-epimerase
MRYVVTGGAGRVGSALAARLAALDETTGVLIADVRHPSAPHQLVASELLDVKDAQRMTLLLERERADVVVHLACSHESSAGRQAMYETNVVGTNSVLAAAAAAGTGHVVALSSAACYPAAGDGAPVSEAVPLRSEIESELARDRATVDRLCQLWAARQPERTMTIVRPCAVLTSAPDDGVTGLFTQPPHVAGLASPEAAVQFLHEDDFADALAALSSGGHGGVFNLAGDGTVALGECARLVGLKGPRGARRVYSKLRRNGSRAAIEELELLVGTPVLATERMRNATGWSPQPSAAAFKAAMGARGKLVGAPV